jgi:hypothetical protein
LSKIDGFGACQKSMAVSEFEVQRIVSELIGSSSCGPDQIPAKALKFILPSILSPLTILVNLSFLNGTFPSALKSARLVVLHKGGSRDDPSNYRPISLLSAFSKIFEKCMYSRLLSFLDKKKTNNFSITISLVFALNTQQNMLAWSC